MGNKGLRYAVRDGFVGLRRHPLILIASVSTMFLMLMLVAFFLLFSMNVRAFLEEAGKQPPIEIQFRTHTEENTVRALDEQLAGNAYVVEHHVVSPEENFALFKERIGKDELFDEFDYQEHIPWTILLRLSDPNLASTFKEEVMKFPGVFDVMMETALLNILQASIRNAGIASAILLPILGLISVLIINNMIRMIALSRSSELSIMKTMGATDAYIRIPFVIEALFVAFISSLLAFLVTFLAYRALLHRFNGSGGMNMLPMARIALPIIAVLLVSAVAIATISSVRAVRRYLAV